jgi:hypothetical protein
METGLSSDVKKLPNELKEIILYYYYVDLEKELLLNFDIEKIKLFLQCTVGNYFTKIHRKELESLRRGFIIKLAKHFARKNKFSYEIDEDGRVITNYDPVSEIEFKKNLLFNGFFNNKFSNNRVFDGIFNNRLVSKLLNIEYGLNDYGLSIEDMYAQYVMDSCELKQDENYVNRYIMQCEMEYDVDKCRDLLSGYDLELFNHYYSYSFSSISME